MGSVIVGRACDRAMSPVVLRGMFRLRDRVFRERMQWDVESREGLERDAYDGLDPVYVVATSTERSAEGCLRLLPTTGPYMLPEVFSCLLRGEAAPRDPRVWEISRFAVSTSTRPLPAGHSEQSAVCETALALMRRAYAYAVERGIERYVAVTGIAFERLLCKLDLPVRRFGDGKMQRVGRDLAVALWIEIDERCRQALHADRPAADEREAA